MKPQRETPGFLRPLLGLTLEEAEGQAKEAGYQVRVSSVDGVGQVVTCDYRRDRINLELDAGKVITAFIG